MEPWPPDASIDTYEEAPGTRSGAEPAEVAIPQDRGAVTHEPDQAGSHPVPWHEDVDWIGWSNQGGGYVPADYGWLSNPKEEQERASAG